MNGPSINVPDKVEHATTVIGFSPTIVYDLPQRVLGIVEDLALDDIFALYAESPRDI